MGHMDTTPPDDGLTRCHLTLCFGQILNAVVVGAETVDDSAFDVGAALSTIERPCAHHIHAALVLLDATYSYIDWSPSRVYEMAPAIMASVLTGDITC